jgi:hypothetical protein
VGRFSDFATMSSDRYELWRSADGRKLNLIGEGVASAPGLEVLAPAA